ncbi:hypothetical protein EYF80_048767 [Liparis tanakae]|uniref:Uncharacterized protein n=1 Tax=Liparis tanakae TaxID=230148 RepID=A0A4Z2FIN0_9TELE|nr:hypothetical protein EYF80_048767 [Liparis tanakae]
MRVPVFVVDFLPLPPCQQVTGCSSKPSRVHAEVSLFEQWGEQWQEEAARSGGRRHLSARFRLPDADVYLRRRN